MYFLVYVIYDAKTREKRLHMTISFYGNYCVDIFCVCFDVMYSGEYFFDVTLSVYPHRAG
jgi:hypothetical protein